MAAAMRTARGLSSLNTTICSVTLPLESCTLATTTLSRLLKSGSGRSTTMPFFGSNTRSVGAWLRTSQNSGFGFACASPTSACVTWFFSPRTISFSRCDAMFARMSTTLRVDPVRPLVSLPFTEKPWPVPMPPSLSSRISGM